MPKSEHIQCAHYRWRMFRRDGVYYACGRKNGFGKLSLNTRDREEALRQLVELDVHCSNQRKEVRETEAAAEITSIILATVSISDGWQRYLNERDSPVHLGGSLNRARPLTKSTADVLKIIATSIQLTAGMKFQNRRYRITA